MNTKRMKPEYTSWAADQPRLVTVFLDEVLASYVPFDDIAAFGVACEVDGLLCLDGSIQVWTVNGVEEAKPGEWIVEVGKLGEGYRRTFVIMPGAVFEDEFSPLDSDAKALMDYVDEEANS